jgi:hypothetical protein
MRLSRFVMLVISSAALGACGKDTTTTPALPPLSEVRFINGVADTGGVDIHAVDQVNLSPLANNLAYRAATQYFPTEVGVRHFRIFPTSTNINVTSQVMGDASVTLPEGRRITLLLTGSARAGTVALWMIDDSSDPPPAGQVAVRLVNAGTGVINGYLVNTATTPLPPTETFSAVGTLTQSPYVDRPTGIAAVRVTDAGSTTVNASLAGPPAPAPVANEKPAAGVTSEGTNFSVYYFAPGAPGSANAAVSTPTLIWFVDRNPCDEPAVAACAP